MPLVKNLEFCQDEKVALVSQMSKMNDRLIALETECLQLKENPKTSKTRKMKLSGFELDLEENSITSELKLVAALERNSQLERDLSQAKDELNQSLKWTNPSKILTNLAN